MSGLKETFLSFEFSGTGVTRNMARPGAGAGAGAGAGSRGRGRGGDAVSTPGGGEVARTEAAITCEPSRLRPAGHCLAAPCFAPVLTQTCVCGILSQPHCNW